MIGKQMGSTAQTSNLFLLCRYNTDYFESPEVLDIYWDSDKARYYLKKLESKDPGGFYYTHVVHGN